MTIPFALGYKAAAPSFDAVPGAPAGKGSTLRFQPGGATLGGPSPKPMNSMSSNYVHDPAPKMGPPSSGPTNSMSGIPAPRVGPPPSSGNSISGSPINAVPPPNQAAPTTMGPQQTQAQPRQWKFDPQIGTGVGMSAAERAERQERARVGDWTTPATQHAAAPKVMAMNARDAQDARNNVPPMARPGLAQAAPGGTNWVGANGQTMNQSAGRVPSDAFFLGNQAGRSPATARIGIDPNTAPMSREFGDAYAMNALKTNPRAFRSQLASGVLPPDSALNALSLNGF